MRLHRLGLGVLVVTLPALAALYACGTNGGTGGGNGDGGNGSDGSLGGDTISFGADGGAGYDAPLTFIDGGFTAPDCPGCTFPGPGAPACATGTPPINIVYPYDGVLVPPNMNVISVMWTPFGTAFQEFEVDFTNAITDMHVVTKCSSQTIDTEQPAPVASGGCELQLSPAMWQFVANQNRGGAPVTITVRGTTDGTCANSSASTVQMAFAQDDMLGVIYYWKSTISSNGVGGQVWEKSFGDSNPETDVTSAFGSTCNGCHALSRDGQRIFIDSDDDDSDDEYGDVASSLIDMSAKTPIGGGGGRGNMPPGFASFYPDHTKFLHLSRARAVQPALELHVPLRRQHRRRAAERHGRHVHTVADDGGLGSRRQERRLRHPDCGRELGRKQPDRRRPRLRRQPLHDVVQRRHLRRTGAASHVRRREQLLPELLARRSAGHLRPRPARGHGGHSDAPAPAGSAPTTASPTRPRASCS